MGKSSLLKEAASKLGYEYIHATSGLLQHLGFGKDYEKLRALSQKERDVRYVEYIEAIVSSEKDFLLDAHYLGLVRGKVDKVSGPWLEKFDVCVLVSAPLDDVWNRILADSRVRDRALFSAGMSEIEMKKMLAAYQLQTKDEFDRLVSTYKKPNIEIYNEQGKMDEAVARLTDFVFLH